MNKLHLPLVVSLIIILSSAPIAYAMFLTPVEIIDITGDGVNTLDGPFSIATDSSGNVFVAGQNSDNVFKITPTGTITEIIDITGDGVNAFNFPIGITTDLSDNVFVSARFSDNIFKIATPGTCSTGGTVCTITEILDNTGDGGGNTFFDGFGIATDLSGNVFVAGRGINNAFKIATPGTCSTGGTVCTITEIIDITGDGGGNTLNAPEGIATDLSGNVFVTGAFSDNAFKITTPGTCSTGGTVCTITEIIDNAGDGGSNTLNNPIGVATDLAGIVFVTGFGSDNAFKITPGGTITEIIDGTGDGGGNTFVAPFGIATDLSDNVFVAGRASGNVFKITPTGTITEIIDSTGDGAGNALFTVFSIATDLSGNVFVAGFSSDNAFKLELDVSNLIGGTLLPLDTIALLLAGAQSFTWMLPVLLSVLGIGLFVASRKSE